MKVLITGATGAVGPCVVRSLCKAGHIVRAFSLDKPLRDTFPPNVEELVGDVTDQAAVQSAMHGIDAVIHLAALLHVVNPPPELREKYERINVGGTECVISESLRAGVRRVVLFSTIAVYGPSHGRVLDEDTPPHPDGFYAQTKLAAEGIVLKARCSDGKPLGTVLRMGAIYGARIKGNYRRLLQSLACGRFIPIGKGDNRRTLVYDKDAAQAATLVVSHDAAGGAVYNVSDGQFHTLGDIITTMCQALNRQPPCWALPVKPVRMAAAVIEDVTRCLGIRSPVGRALIDKYVEDIAVSGERIRTRLGFSPEYDLAAGWRETVQEMRQRGEL